MEKAPTIGHSPGYYHKGRAAMRHYANQPSLAVPYDLCVCITISHLLAMG